LAGLFGLEVYLISLLDPALTETDLMALFNSLPRRCIVLLEDIDSAGLKRPDGEVASSSSSRGTVTRKKASSTQGANEELSAANGISLSGLLNAIDGVASHEGRVLVMTTNFPEKLDDALIRPGRVDMKIEFTLATKHQIREIFIRMYDTESKEPKTAEMSDKTNQINKLSHSNGHLAPPASKENGFLPSKMNGHVKKRSIDVATEELLKPLLTKQHAKWNEDDLNDLAERFVSKVPENNFSPAEVQNFLIPRKKNPWSAVGEVDQWVYEMLAAIETKASIDEEIQAKANAETMMQAVEKVKNDETTEKKEMNST
jgi:chaperone BCS1